MPTVKFWFHTGVRQRRLSSVTLTGSWDAAGQASEAWSQRLMNEVIEPDGTLSYEVSVVLKGIGSTFEWGVRVDTRAGNTTHTGQWAVAAELKDWQDRRQIRRFTLGANGQVERYYLTRLSQLGANIQRNVAGKPVRFSVWAPNARAVALVFGHLATGYIDNQGGGVIDRGGVADRHAMQSVGAGVWQVELPVSNIDTSVYMFEIVDDAGHTRYRTDLYSRCQVGSGDHDPDGAPFSGAAIELDGRVSCSFIMDPTLVESPIRSGAFIDEATFWKDEFSPDRPVPKQASDLVIYELHVGALGYNQPRPGNLTDAIALIPYLLALGVNAVELLPISEFSGAKNWGYGTTHFCAVEFSSGGPDHLKAFVKACHQRGIAVILDVVYNHYPDAERAEWQYDSSEHQRNIYYWYEGNPSDYQTTEGATFPEGGYVDNESSGWAPAFHDEMVRGLFASSAVHLMLDFHIDGFRVDQTTSIHEYPKLKFDGRPADQAKIFGAKFLREFARTLRLLEGEVILLAEDHSTFDEVLRPIDDGGMGFDAKWYNEFYHHLIGDTGRSPNLLSSAGYGGNRGLDMGFFGSLLERTGPQSVVFHESHDEAGNSKFDEGRQRSRRTILAAVNQAEPSSLTGGLRGYAEARTRVVAGLSLLSAGVPMFLMGEEIGAAKPYRYDDWFLNRENLAADRQGVGANLFRFFSELIALRHRLAALKAPNIKVVHAHDDNRVIAFKRWSDHSEALVLATLSNDPFPLGYAIHHEHIPAAQWREVFSSDSAAYGGLNFGNGGAAFSNSVGEFNAILPANGFVVFERL